MTESNQEMQNAVPAPRYDHELDTCGLNCPLPILRTKKALAGLTSGELLKVMATDPGAIRDFHAFARQTGHEMVHFHSQDGVFDFYLRKR